MALRQLLPYIDFQSDDDQLSPLELAEAKMLVKQEMAAMAAEGLKPKECALPVADLAEQWDTLVSRQLSSRQDTEGCSGNLIARRLGALANAKNSSLGEIDVSSVQDLGKAKLDLATLSEYSLGQRIALEVEQEYGQSPSEHAVLAIANAKIRNATLNRNMHLQERGVRIVNAKRRRDQEQLQGEMEDLAAEERAVAMEKLRRHIGGSDE